jgi:hypothetical protein
MKQVTSLGHRIYKKGPEGFIRRSAKATIDLGGKAGDTTTYKDKTGKLQKMVLTKRAHGVHVWKKA